MQDYEFVGELVNGVGGLDDAVTVLTAPYISCDSGQASDHITEAFNKTRHKNVKFAILYSEVEDHCVIADQLVLDESLHLFTTLSKKSAQRILDSVAAMFYPVYVLPDQWALPINAEGEQSSSRSGSPIREFIGQLFCKHRDATDPALLAMIVLYSLTSLVTALLLFVIVGGAIKARRHPERYGPRAVLRPGQSRAKGIAMAMLETLPIVRFGQHVPKQEQSNRRDVEMNDPAETPQVTTKDARPNTPPTHTNADSFSDNTATGVASASSNTASGGLAVAATRGDAQASNSEISAVSRRPSSDGAIESSPSCSICTEDFVLGEEVRVLPCDHKFHPYCVDPWLLNVSGTCPLCRIDLRTPQDSTHERRDFAGLSASGFLSPSSRPRSTIGSIVRGARGLDIQALLSASREERISILRRWRDEMRQRDIAAQGDANNTTASPRRSVRLSQWLRESFVSQPSSQIDPEADSANRDASSVRSRPRTWFGNDGSAATAIEEAMRSQPTREGRARTWYGDQDAASGEGSSQSRNLDARPHSMAGH